MFVDKRIFGAAVLAAALLSSPAPGQDVKRPPPPQGFPVGPTGHVDTFTADPSTIKPGESSTLTWTAVNADDTSIDQCIGVVPTRGNRQVSPKATTTYTFSAAGRGGSGKQSVTVTVVGTTPISPDAGNKGCVAEENLPIPQMDGHPDLSGVYIGGFGITGQGPAPVKPGSESFKLTSQEQDLGQGVLCVPPGIPAATTQPYPMQIIQKPGLVVILYEAYNLFRVIPTDGSTHPADLDPTWMGNSVGHWDGDTLVIDVTGFNDKTIIGGYHHTTAYHVVERFRRTRYDLVQYEATVDDPNLLATSWKFAGILKLHPEWQIQEYVCEENNQNYQELLNKNQAGASDQAR